MNVGGGEGDIGGIIEIVASRWLDQYIYIAGGGVITVHVH
jgi:hypothetical protein